MTRVWFTSDTHFNHARIVELSHRPFSSVDKMNEEMIYRWNTIVREEDIVLHLGDFAFGGKKGAQEILDQLVGQKYLIQGNHDPDTPIKGWRDVREIWHRKIPLKYWWTNPRTGERVFKTQKRVTLCHYAMKTWPNAMYGAWQLYGHSHGGLPGNSQSLDVGVDAWDFAPVSPESIAERMATLPHWRAVDHHGAVEEAP